MSGQHILCGGNKMDVLLTATDTAGTMGTMLPMIAWIVVIGVFMYLMVYRPQKKEQAKRDSIMASLEVGDAVLTTGGFYGMIIDITDDTVIVEFGNNKNCRIPMKKTAIQEVEKPGAE